MTNASGFRLSLQPLLSLNSGCPTPLPHRLTSLATPVDVLKQKEATKDGREGVAIKRKEKEERIWFRPSEVTRTVNKENKCKLKKKRKKKKMET